MSGTDDALGLVYLVGVLAIFGSALLVRRIPIGQSLRMAAAWVLIFLAAFVLFTVKDDIFSLGRRVWNEVSGGGKVVQAGDTLRIRKDSDGHFWVEARLNDEKVRFMVDSGATVTSISAETAQRAGVEPSRLQQVKVNTANGEVIARRGRARLRVGEIERPDHGVIISPAFGDMDVIGMNFLSSLSGWGVEGEWLVLKP